MTGNEIPDHFHQSFSKGELEMRLRLRLILERINFLIIAKIIGTILLLGIIFIWTMIIFVIVPMVMIAATYCLKKKMHSSNYYMMMIPAGVCTLLIWRIWYPKWNPRYVDSKRFDSIRRYLPAPAMKRPVQ